jgi:peptidoglycan/LPS O-acetylase OafA/YrhL
MHDKTGAHRRGVISEAGGKLRQHRNAFDLIRLFAAGLVVWSHQHALLGLPEPTVGVLRTSFGGLGVFIFFVVSGYLNTLSVSRHNSVRVFLLNRALRIYPALAVCVAFTVVLGFFAASDLRAFVSPKLLSYLVKDTTLFFGVKAGVPGVFEANKYPEALNGSIWTLPYEVKMYVVLVLYLAIFRYSLAALLMAFAGFSVIAIVVALGILPLPNVEYDEFWLQFSTLFLAGSAVAAAQMVAGLPFAIGGLILLTLLFAGIGQAFLAWQLLLTATVIAAGSIRLPKWLRPPLDLSYGIYLYAWPVQQISAVLTNDFWLALVFSTTIIFALALMSALFIERPALRLKTELQLPSWPTTTRNARVVKL